MAYNELKADISGLLNELEKYSTEVMNDIDKEANRIANRAKNELKRTSPYRPHNKPSEGGEHYRDSWKKKQSKHRSQFSQTDSIQLLSKTKPRLTHLLENGHRVVLPAGKKFKRQDAKRYVEAIKHIQPVQEEVNNAVITAVDNILRRHGK